MSSKLFSNNNKANQTNQNEGQTRSTFSRFITHAVDDDQLIYFKGGNDETDSDFIQEDIVGG